MKKFFYIASIFSLMLCTYNLKLYAENKKHKHEKSKKVNDSKNFWTCSMHPKIMLPSPGKCPICGMDLIPVSDTSTSNDDNNFVSLTLSDTAEKLASIQTAKVKRKKVKKQIRLFGSIDFDETRLTHITAWVPGRIERMFVDYTGIKVKKGEHMFELYSPDLISAQEELIQAIKSRIKLRNSSSSLVASSTKKTSEAAKEKLILLGLKKEQVDKILKTSKVQDKVTIYAPTGGIVVERNATEGMYVNEGSRIYSIADLNHLWVYLDAYESNLPWIRYGQKATFTTQAVPGKKFEGIVSFISPLVDPKTRTTKVRVNIHNPNGLLKPGLFVSGIIEAHLYSQGKVFEEYLRDKYVCPMHPEVIKNKSGTCPICEMDLVKAEKLGTFIDADNLKIPLVIPITAVLHTGKRSIVYVKKGSEYLPREIVLGPKTESFYIVKSGLQVGEYVVTNGAFKIDADLQIKGKKSMMNPEANKQNKVHNHNHKKNTVKKSELPNKLENIVKTYFDLSEVLANDDLSLAKKEFEKLKELSEESNFLPKNIFEKDTSLKEIRINFQKVTKKILDLSKNYKLNAYKAYCPMAMGGKGAFWIQKQSKIKNPYYGASMLACGSIKGEL